MRKDLLIIGGGLAGSQTAFFAHQNGLSFDLVHDTTSHCASRIATGLINPIVLRHITLSWNASEVIPLAIDHYRKLSFKFNSSIFEDKPIYRPLYEEGELNTWLSKEKEDRFKAYLSHEPSLDTQHIRTPISWGKINSSGRVNTEILLQELHNFYKGTDSFIDIAFDLSQLNLTDDTITFRDTHYKNVIFAQGHQHVNNALFSDIPLNQTKGEIHTYKNNYKTQYLISRGVFIVPISETELEIGSTFNWEDKDWEATTAGQKEIEQKLEKTISKKLDHISGKAGLRPTSKDRRPVIGAHKAYKNVFIHNGLGTKGVSLSPYTAKALVDHITSGKPIPIEIDIKRFYK